MQELKLDVLREPERTGDSVTEVCRPRGISRQTFYVDKRRYLAGGLEGVAPHSKRPRSSPGRIEPQLEAMICGLRKEHPRWGARRIRTELKRSGTVVPGQSTVHQALKRNQLVAPQPRRRVNADKRFERELANDLWQIDATRVELACGEAVWVVDCLDDHARFLLFALACKSPTGEAAWACFAQASAAYGLPRQLLSDNHLSFTGRRYGQQVAFERNLAQLGVELLNAAPSHPQTLGKLERLQRTLKDWLQDEGPAADLEQLQALLERFRSHYNGSARTRGSAIRRRASASCPARRRRPRSTSSPTTSTKTPPTRAARSCARSGRPDWSATRAWGSCWAGAGQERGCRSSPSVSSSTSTTARSCCGRWRSTAAGATRHLESADEERR